MPVENIEVRSAGVPRRTDPLPALMVERMRKTFGSRLVLDIEALEVRPGSVHALLGQNGSGKSTLIKVLSGFHLADEEDADAVLVSGRALVDARSEDCRFVHQDLGLIPEMSVLDNLYLVRGFPTRNGAVAQSHAEQSARSALTAVGLDHQDVNALVSEFSPARRTAIAIARALMDGGDTVKLLVLDEPTATLPRPDVADLMSTLRTIASKGVGVLYVTHHLDEVFEIADDVTILRDGTVVAAGPIGAFDRESVVHHLAGDIMESVRDAIVSRAPIPTDQAVFSAANVVGERVEGVSVELRAGEIVGFHGLTGSGRDTLLGVLYGSRARWAGSVVVLGKTLAPRRPDLAIASGIGFVSASRKIDGIVMELTCRENLMLTATGKRRPGMRIDRRSERSETSEWIDRLQIRPTDAVDLPVAQLSGGNQQKVAIARWLRLQPQVLMLDEPTQGVDVGAKAQIHTALTAAAAEGAAILIASSDVEELASLCSVVHVMQHGRILDSVSGADLTVSQLNRRLNQAAHDSIGSSP